MKNVFETLIELEKQIKTLNEFELISLENAKGRFLYEDLRAKKDLPSFDNAALDGYAFNYEDKNEPLSIKGTIFAGDKKTYKLEKNECYKIMTGAKMPKNADTILMLEDENLQNGKLIISKEIKQNNAYRYKGEELKKGELILKKGELLTSAKIALLASQGLYKIKVFRKVKIGIFSSGNELKEAWESCDDDNIYNVNALALNALFSSPSCEVSYLGIIKDDLASTKEAFEEQNFDILLCSGGASVGEADFMEEALNSLEFKAVFKGLKARPARPTKLYEKNSKFVLVLPGNPMAAYLACFIFGLKILRLLCANLDNEPKIFAKMGKTLKLKSGRNNFVLGKVENGFFYPTNDNKFGSGMIKPLIQSEFLLISDENQNELKEGEELSFILL